MSLHLMFLTLLAFCVIRAAGKQLRLEKTAGVNQPPVPRDIILKPRFRFPAPSFEDISRAYSTAHVLSEITYAGNGYWDCPGEYKATLRNTSNRVIGYISGYKALGNETYKQRAIEGLEYLLRAQSEEGDFPWYYNSYYGVYNRDDGLFEAGIAGKAFIEGYKLTGDSRYLDASYKVARWEMDCPLSPNNNYNMFSVWHLAAHYKATGDTAALESAIEKAKLGGMPGQMPSGGWPGHNSWMWYHGIIVRGLAELLRALPEGHSFAPELKSSLTAAINRVVREQVSSGEIQANPKVKRRGHTNSFILNALLIARGEYGDSLDKCIYGIMRNRLSKLPDENYVRAYAKVWRKYTAARESARAAATGAVVWEADFSRFVKDVEWGEVIPDAFNCWYPENEFKPGVHKWQKAQSERTGICAQEITSTGAKLFGGLGWNIPRGALIPGRRYRFTAYVKCIGNGNTVPLVMCSAYGGKKRVLWDPFSDCEFTRENPKYGSYLKTSVYFTASSSMNNVYVWIHGQDLKEDESVSIIVDEASITDAGLPLPEWDPEIDAFENEHDMLMAPPGAYLETMFADLLSPMDDLAVPVG